MYLCTIRAEWMHHFSGHRAPRAAVWLHHQGGIRRQTMKTKRKYFYLDDYEHRLLVGCLVTARNEYIHENKPIEDVNALILKIIDAPSKKLRVVKEEE